MKIILRQNLSLEELRLLKKYLVLRTSNEDILGNIQYLYNSLRDSLGEKSIYEILQGLVEDFCINPSRSICSWKELVKFVMTSILEIEHIPNRNFQEDVVRFHHLGVSFHFFLGEMNDGFGSTFQTILLSELTIKTSVKNLFGEYYVDCSIGSGTFSTVFKIRSNETGDIFALKVFSVDDVDDLSANDDMRHELDIMRKISGIKGVIQPSEAFEINIFGRTLSAYTMEFYQDGPISGNCFSTVKNDEIFFWLFRIAQITRECNTRGVFHGDIKPQNILMKMGPILADFGIALVNTHRENWYLGSSDVRYTQWYRDPWNFQKDLKDFRVSIYSEIWALLLTMMSLFSKGGYNYMDIFSVFRNGGYFQPESQTKIDSAIDYLFARNHKESAFFKKWLNITRFMDINRTIPPNHPTFFNDLYNEFIHDIEALLPKTKPSPVLETDSD
jgi:Protein kinase domain